VATRTVDDDDRPARPDTERTVVVRDDDDVRRVS
jgi:hypothetical protein